MEMKIPCGVYDSAKQGKTLHAYISKFQAPNPSNAISSWYLMSVSGTLAVLQPLLFCHNCLLQVLQEAYNILASKVNVTHFRVQHCCNSIKTLQRLLIKQNC